MNKHTTIGLALVVVLGCSEQVDPDGDGSGMTGAGAGATTSGGGAGNSTGGGNGGSGNVATGGTGAQGAPYAINEISADGDDWIELYNLGPDAVDLTGLFISDDDGGAPKVDEKVELSGGVIEPGGFLFILADLDTLAMVGPQTDCGPGPSPCFHAPWGLSAGDGDHIYILDADDDVVLSAPYPGNAAAEPATWSRVPDGSGEFVVGVATPGAPNQAM